MTCDALLPPGDALLNHARADVRSKHYDLNESKKAHIVMPARHLRLPVATGTIRPDFAISVTSWHRLEQTYGYKIPNEVRTSIGRATVKYLWRDQMERKAGSLDSAQAYVSALYKNTDTLLQKLQDIRDCKDDTRTFVGYAIGRQLGFAGRSESLRQYGSRRPGPIVDRFTHLVRDLSDLRSALTAIAAEGLRFIEPQQEGQAFGDWILDIKSIMRNARLPSGARKDGSISAVDSPFVKLLCALQNHFPPKNRPFTDLKSMAEAVHRYGRAKRRGVFAAKPSRN
jgi:hypothetical protein